QAGATKTKLKKRQGELSRLLRKLFEDNAVGLVNDENYAVMFKAYQDEQAEVMVKLRNIKAESAKGDDYRVNAEKLREIIREYLDIQELT
ncbi:MAG TPA: recombinase, partial [Ruminococcaceae bacterium]|nr:recombinase [Oscillospiraceae bacterium]